MVVTRMMWCQVIWVEVADGAESGKEVLAALVVCDWGEIVESLVVVDVGKEVVGVIVIGAGMVDLGEAVT